MGTIPAVNYLRSRSESSVPIAKNRSSLAAIQISVAKGIERIREGDHHWQLLATDLDLTSAPNGTVPTFRGERILDEQTASPQLSEYMRVYIFLYILLYRCGV